MSQPYQLASSLVALRLVLKFLQSTYSRKTLPKFVFIYIYISVCVFFKFIYLCVYLFMYLFIYLLKFIYVFIYLDIYAFTLLIKLHQITYLFIFYRSKAHIGRLFHSLRTTFLDVDFRINSIGYRPLG